MGRVQKKIYVYSKILKMLGVFNQEEFQEINKELKKKV
jgi:hypothetical protein